MGDKERHSLLERQIRKYVPESLRDSNELKSLFEAIDSAYRESDRDRASLERSLELSSNELMEINTELRARIDSLPDLLLDLDLDGVIRNTKAGKNIQVPFKTDKIVGEKLSALLPTTARQSFEFIFNRTKEDGLSRVLDYIVESPIAKENRAFELRIYRGIESHIIVIIRDISERHHFEQQMIRSQKMHSIGELAAGVAHEINNPIQYITYNLSFLEEEMEEVLKKVHATGASEEEYSSREQKELERIQLAFQHTRDGIDQIAKIVKAIHEFSHPGKLEASRANLNDLVDKALIVTSNHWKYLAEVKLELDPKLPELECYPSELSQVLVNLLVNATQAIGEENCEGGRRDYIQITTKNIGDGVEIQISDSGMGMDEDTISKIFNPFFTTKEVGEGTGLGLALVHNIVVEKHHGAIRVESTPGSGTTFFIRIPYNISETNYLYSPSGAFQRETEQSSESLTS